MVTSDTLQQDESEKELINKIVEQGIFEFKPTLEKTGIRYKMVEKLLEGTEISNSNQLLENLREKGILESQVTDRILMCPTCSSPEVHSKYACTRCESHNIQYTQLVEHLKCGYIGSKDKFGSSLICPGCNVRLEKKITETAYNEIGSCYECEKCGNRFDRPDIIHFCKRCGSNFTYRNAKYEKILLYKLSDKLDDTFNQITQPVLDSLQKILSEKGYKVQLHAQTTGASGVKHLFDVLAEKDETRIVIDMSVKGDKNDMITLLGKKADVNPTKALIVDLSRSAELSKLGKIYGIDVIEGINNIKDNISLETHTIKRARSLLDNSH